MNKLLQLKNALNINRRLNFLQPDENDLRICAENKFRIEGCEIVIGNEVKINDYHDTGYWHFTGYVSFSFRL